jgi:hypothetical protein
MRTTVSEAGRDSGSAVGASPEDNSLQLQVCGETSGAGPGEVKRHCQPWSAAGAWPSRHSTANTPRETTDNPAQVINLRAAPRYKGRAGSVTVPRKDVERLEDRSSPVLAP